MDSPILSGSGGSEASSPKPESEDDERLQQSELGEEQVSGRDDHEVSESSKEVIDIIMNVATLFDLREEDWTKDTFSTIAKFVSDAEQPVLLIYFENFTLTADSAMPTYPVRDIMYYIRTSEVVITPENFFDDVIFGNLVGSMEGSVLMLYEHLYCSPIFENPSWPEGVKGELFNKMHEFLAHLTDLHYKLHGLTILYVPHEAIRTPVKDASKDKELIQRLEGLVMMWCRQLRVAIGDATQNSAKTILTPKDEFQFWEYRWESLNLLIEQVDAPEVLHLIEILTVSQSSYLLLFRTLKAEMTKAIQESKSNIVYLGKLMLICQKIDQESKPENITTHIPWFLNLVREIWLTSPFYNTPDKITLLLKCLVNQVIVKCTEFIDIDGVFDAQSTRAAIVALRANVISCRKFRMIYDEMVKAHNELNSNWNLDVAIIFGNLDSFIRRNFDFTEICEAMITFGRMDETGMEKPSFCGTKGADFDKIVDNVEAEFKTALLEVSKVRHHILNVLESKWQKELLKFRGELRRLELILLHLLSMTMQEVSTVSGGLMTLQAFYNYSHRPVIYRLFQEKTSELWKIFLTELHTVREQLLSTDPPRYATTPFHAGPVFVADLQRIRLHCLKAVLDGAVWLPQMIITEEATLQIKYVDSRLETLSKYRVLLWNDKLNDDLAEKFTRPLVRRSSMRPGLLEINFDLELSTLIHELTYWQMLNCKLPEPVQEITEKCSRVGVLYENVLALVLDYNRIISALSDKERLLFRELIRRVDTKVGPMLFRYDWNVENFDDVIKEVYRSATWLMSLVKNYKAALSEMLSLCELLADTKMISIASGVIYDLVALEEHMEDCRTQAFLKIVEIYEEFLKHLLVIWEGFEEVISSTGSPWRNFILKLDVMMEKALLLCVKQSMQVMLDALKGDFSLINCSIHLEYGKVTFKPTLQRVSSLGNHFLPEVGGALKLVPRVSSKFDLRLKDPPPFHDVIDCDKDCRELQATINNEVAKNVQKIQEYLNTWEPYRRFWEDDKHKFVVEYEQNDPSPVDWDNDISGFDGIVAATFAEEANLTVHFTRLDCGPLRLGISQHCGEWKNMLCQLLLKNTEKTINDIFVFCDTQIASLAEEPKNLEALQSALDHFETLSKSADDVSAVFPRIHEYYAILQKNEVQLSPELTDKLKNMMKGRWNDYLNALSRAFEMLERSKEAFKAGLMEQAETARAQVNDLVTKFKENGPFDNKWSANDALRYLQRTEFDLVEQEKREEKLRDELAAFNVSHTINRELQTLKEDASILKASWAIISDWSKAWKNYKGCNVWKLDIAAIDAETGELIKTMNRLGIELLKLGWNIMDVAIESLEAVRRCLPLLNELKNPALRKRHWQVIQDLARNDFDSESLTFGAVLTMRLYEHGHQIYDMSRVASLELGIENNLKNIKDKWEKNSITLEPYKDLKGVYRLLAVDKIIQDIEDHVSMLTSMKGTNFANAFLTDIKHWEKTLSTVDEGLDLILTAQRQWMYLDNIFSGEDIRGQIPAEATVFDELTVKWRSITAVMNEQLNAVRVCHEPGLFKNLGEMLTTLDGIQKALTIFLENKRHVFPRFYFISNDDLLEILGNSKAPEMIQPHFKKLFDNIASIAIVRAAGKIEALSMTSSDGETVNFQLPIHCQGPVEFWLSELEATMKTAIKNEIKAARLTLKKSLGKRDKWINNHPGQVCISTSQIQWTSDCYRALISCAIAENRTQLKKLKQKEKKILHTLTDLIRSGPSKIVRLKAVALITIEIHARDVVDNLYKANCNDVNAFEWMSQLRFYWDKTKDECLVRQTNTCFNYGYEYLGNSGRLAITPLTDRCYITLTTALHLHRGASPKGPAGTGKTETVKDLGKALAAYVIVFNCSEGLDYKSMGRLFSGLAQSGAWGCFDEFNRINIEVLSVVAQQISSILTALAANRASFAFEGSEINLAASCGIFITMNPGYAGRTELPDNLKAMFRPISMVVPDYAVIAEVTLYAEGFNDSKSLANKVVTLFNLSVQQLSKQDHYDFGLRGMVSILRHAGTKRRALSHLTDAEVLLLSMHEMNVAKLTASDLGLFIAMTKDLFPGVEPPLVSLTVFRNVVAKELQKMSLQPVPAVIDKVIQLFETQNSRHAVMLVGHTCTGKTTIWRTLKATLSALGADGYYPVIDYSINPKTLSLGELFGEMSLNTGEWMDGVISAIMRRVCSEETLDRKWIVFDGPVDAAWIENMNSAMDDNKILTLINSERISMPEQVSFLFEVEDLSVASPATVSRAGMVYLDYANLSWLPYVTSWLQSLESEMLANELRQYFNSYLERVLEFKRTNCTELVTVHELACVRSFCKLLEVLCLKNVADIEPNTEKFTTCVKLWFHFCLTWTVCGTLTEDSRRKFDAFLRETESIYPVKGTIYEYFVDMKQNRMSLWESKLDDHWVYNPSLSFHDVVVPTIDTVRYEYFLSTWLDSRQPLLFVGPVGGGKSCIVQQHLQRRRDSKFSAALSASTSSRGLQDLLESRLEKRTKGTYGPPGGRRLIVFLDDFNMPAKDYYGAQPPLELIRQWLGYGFWYDRQKQWRLFIKDVSVVAAMGPTGGGRNQIPNRLLSLFNVIALTFPNDGQIIRIYLTMLKQHLGAFDEEVKVIAESITKMTVLLFSNMVESMLPTPKKMHYLFNLRDVSRVFQGLLRSHKDCQNTPKRFLTLWVHEAFRVFHDRLIDETDSKRFVHNIDELLGNHMEFGLSALCPDHRPQIFGDFMNPLGRYEEINSVAALRLRLENTMKEFNQIPGNIPLRLVFFRDAIDHVCRIARVISQPRGNVLLVGVGGSGRSSLAKLALYLCGQRLFTISVTKKYNVPEFREDLKLLYRQTGVQDKVTGFHLDDSHLVTEEFLEIVNSILSTGEVSSLYRSDELEEIRSSLKGTAELSADNILPFLVDRARRNMHIILTMNPLDDRFRARLMRYPALVACTTIDWFLPWPREALVEVAEHTLEGCDFTDRIFENSYKISENQATLLKKVMARLFSDVHASLDSASNDMLRELGRICYVTPSSFLHLLSTYLSLLADKREVVRLQALKLRNGLGKIEEAGTSISAMSAELEHAQGKVLVIREQCEAALLVLDEKRNQVDDQAKVVKERSDRISEEELVCRKLARAAQDDLDEALPALEEALIALDSLSKKDISELKSYDRPPPKVMMVMDAVCLLKGIAPDWSQSKRLLGEQDFLKSLKEFDKDHITEKTMKKIAVYTSMEDFDPEKVESVSLAARSLCMWVIATENYGKLWRIVGPKKARLDEAMISLKNKQDELTLLESQLNELKIVVDLLNTEHLKNNAELEALQDEANKLKLKLERADMLVNGLADEKLRWELAVVDLEVKFENLLGDCLVPSAFLSYAGPFVSHYRNRLMLEWTNIACSEPELKRTEKLNLFDFLIDPAVVRDWGEMGLPIDDFSTENGILVVRASRYPVIIDPQLQANKWLKNLEKENGLTVLEEDTPQIMKKLELCILNGSPVLLENVSERIEPSLLSVLSKTFIVQSGYTMLKLGDKLVTCNPNFRMFITTKLPNPVFPTELATKTTIVNFLVKQKGLEAQLLGLVVRRERPKLEDLKTKTLRTISEGGKTLMKLEFELLRILYESKGSLLDNEQLFQTLQESRIVSANIKEGIKTAEVTEIEIETARAEYVPCAVRSAVLFMALNDLNRIDPMYQFSLDSYIHLFSQSLEKSAKNFILDLRIKNINEYHTYALYRNVCSALFGRHRLLFSFYICVKILEKDDPILSIVYGLLVRGGVAVNRENQPENPTSFLSENSWNAIVDLEIIPELAGIVQSFNDSPEEWENWFLEINPENAPLFGNWQKLSQAARLLLIKAMREDRLTAAITDFVKSHMGQKYIEPPVFDIRSAFEESSPTIPLIFILSTGADPTAGLIQFAQLFGMQDSLLMLSLGQGQSEIASRSVEKGIRDGCWVFLANCHLSLSWMPALGKIIENLKLQPEINPSFRLWLSSSPNKDFPISILQDGIKMTTEPPQGLKGNVARLYQSITPEQFGRCLSRVNYPKLLLTLSLFHAVLLERRKFKQLGWNVAYSFNDSDFEISENLLRTYLDEYEITPWVALKYLIAEVCYGGHVTDTWDRRLLMTYGNQFLNDDILVRNELRMSPSLNYVLSNVGTLESTNEFIEALPGVDSPEAFGQHPNAEINFLILESRGLCSTLLSMQISRAFEEAESFEDKALAVADEILSQLPSPIDLVAGKEVLDPLGPLEVVLLQESLKYNSLLSGMSQSLNDVKRAVKGNIVMSQELEEMALYLGNGKVPLVWLKSYASLKPLGSWTRDLQRRVEMFSSWISTSRPPLSFWPAAFTFPTALLTAVLQQTARRSGISVDLLSWDFQIITDDISSIKRPETGILVHGLFLEGAGWDYEKSCLKDPLPMQITCKMPIVWFKPTEKSTSKKNGVFNCPAYYYPVRSGSFVIAVDLQCGDYPPEVWIKRGAALLLSSDS